MDAREILIANTKTQKRYKITTDAETLGELKAALDANNIDYSGMTFTEGISKIQLMDDSSPLPKDVDYKGQKTNNLVFLLTNTKKNIASGAYDEMPPRCDIFDIIRENSLEDVIEAHFGRRFIQVSSAELWDFINKYLEENDPGDNNDTIEKTSADKLGQAIYEYVTSLIEDCLCNVEAESIGNALKDAGYAIVDFVSDRNNVDPAAAHAVKDEASNSKIDEVLNDIEL